MLGAALIFGWMLLCALLVAVWSVVRGDAL